MRKLLPFIALLLLVSCGSEPDNPADSAPDFVCEYHFEGTEPFWEMDIQNDSLILFCDNKEVIMKVSFAEKSANGNTIGFSNDKISGIINESWDHNCCYAVTEEDPLPLEIFFVFEGKTYRGCGKKAHSILTFSDGSNVMLGDKYLNYSAIDSIRCTRHSFEATYHSCGKGFFNFQKQDLEFIKDKTLYEEIAYYYVIQDFEENLCEEPTAVLLSQGGEEFYLNTLRGAKNACDFPENSIVSCQAYRLEVFTKEGVFNEVVIYEMNSATRKK